MKIEEVLQKCISTPGVSIKKSDISAELILSQENGSGSMVFYPVFPGITIAYIHVSADTWPAPDLHDEDSESRPPLIINYCVHGRCEMILGNGSYVYVSDKQYSITEQAAHGQYIYPNRVYEGMELFIDTDNISEQCSFIKNYLDMDITDINSIFCPDGQTYISPATTQITRNFQELWSMSDCSDLQMLSRMKVSVLSLLSTLLYSPCRNQQSCTFYTESQVAIAKETARIISSDLRTHHSAWELAKIFSVSETSLKNYFRGVYGQNISAYLRDLRMNRAALLLKETRMSVYEIAGEVGYSNQSKFSAVFRQCMGMSPLEYRRKSGLDDIT